MKKIMVIILCLCSVVLFSQEVKKVSTPNSIRGDWYCYGKVSKEGEFYYFNKGFLALRIKEKSILAFHPEDIHSYKTYELEDLVTRSAKERKFICIQFIGFQDIWIIEKNISTDIKAFKDNMIVTFTRPQKNKKEVDTILSLFLVKEKTL